MAEAADMVRKKARSWSKTSSGVPAKERPASMPRRPTSCAGDRAAVFGLDRVARAAMAPPAFKICAAARAET